MATPLSFVKTAAPKPIDAMAIGEVIDAVELASGSIAALRDMETATMPMAPYAAIGQAERR
jgi:hypothetical protein